MEEGAAANFNTSSQLHLPVSSFSYTTTTTTTATPSSSLPWMDSRIWSKLPQRLLDRILAFLPPPAFFRCRAVCKRWYALLYSNSFLQLSIQITPRTLYCFLFFPYPLKTPTTTTTTTTSFPANDHQGGYLFDPYELAWYRLSFTSIPPGFSPAASSLGLLCWVSDAAGTKSLILCNPLSSTTSLCQLPSTLRPRLFPSLGLRVTPTSIDVTVAGDDLISPYAVKNLSAESFHIDAGGFYSIWGRTSSLPRLCSLESNRMVEAEGKLYCMNYNPFSVLAYDIAGNTWTKIQAPMRRFLRSPSLVETMGKLVLVAAVEKSKLNVPKSLRLWALQEGGGSWAEMERMPLQLHLEFSDVEGGNGFECVGHGEFIVMMIRGTDKGLLFDGSRKQWQWIPPCPYQPVHGGGPELRGFAYQPTLATPVLGLIHQLTLPTSFHSPPAPSYT